MDTKKNIHEALLSIASGDLETAAKLLSPVIEAKSYKIVNDVKEKEDEGDEKEDEEESDKKD